MKTIIGISAAMLLSFGCSIHAVKVETLTIPPNSAPVQVTATCTGTSTYYDLILIAIHKAEAKLDISSSDGSEAR
jgi:hypothetical protein